MADVKSKNPSTVEKAKSKLDKTNLVAESETWWDSLEKDLIKTKEEVATTEKRPTEEKIELNKVLVQDFWRIWLKFHSIGIHMLMEPPYSKFACFDEFPDDWRLREEFNFGALTSLRLEDRTHDQGRVGDGIKIVYYTNEEDKITHLRMVFEFCEGEHYYKYTGWKRVISQYLVVDDPLPDFNIKVFHNILGDLIKAWYESHLRKNREVLLSYIRKTYQKIESFTEP